MRPRRNPGGDRMGMRSIGDRRVARELASRRRAIDRAAGIRVAILGTDGSPHARRAAAFLGRLTPRPGARAIVVSVLEPMRSPSLALMPASTRRLLSGAMAEVEHARYRRAETSTKAAATILARAGWRVETSVRRGIPVEELLSAARETRARLIVLGSRGTSGLSRLLLGSVAEGVVKRSTIPVLLVH